MKSGWHRMAKGESKMSWYAEVILSYIMVIEKQSDMERWHGSPHIVTSHSFLLFFFVTCNFSVFITESQEELWGKSDGYGWNKEKEKKKKKNLRLLGCLSRKRLWRACCNQNSIKLHRLNGSIHVGGGGREKKKKEPYLRNQSIIVEVWGWS